MTTNLPLHTISNEARVLDSDLATQLEMKVPRKIRTDLIEANRSELESYGTLWSDRPQTGGRPATAFYLKEETGAARLHVLQDRQSGSRPEAGYRDLHGAP